MKRPVKPIKPNKGDSGKPCQNLVDTYVICRDDNGKIQLCNLNDQLYLTPPLPEAESLNSNELNQLMKMEGFVNIGLFQAHYEVFYLVAIFETVNLNYEEQLKAHKNRFKIYAQQLEQYQKDLDEYNKFKTQEKIKKLKAEIKKYEK